MSTKIYRAYRVRGGVDIFYLCERFILEGQRQLRATLRKEYEDWLKVQDDGSCLLTGMAALAGQQLKPDEYNPWECGLLLSKLYLKQLGEMGRNPFNLDVEIAVWRYGGRYYLIPYCDGLVRDVLDFLGEDPWLEDFSYWNNTDKPEEVSERRWEHRGKVWGAITKPDVWQLHVTLVICSWAGFYQIDPGLEMFREWRKQNKA